MEENNTVPVSAGTGQAGGCINCGHPVVEQGYPNPLCADCRQRFIRFPIPNWIKFFGAGIGLIFLFSLYKIPKNISLGLHLEKGKTAVAEKKYITAQQELEKFLKGLPQHVEARCYLIIASFYNQDYVTMSRVFNEVKGENIDDKELFAAVQQILDESPDYFPDDKLLETLHQHGDDINKLSLADLKQYLDSNKENNYAATVYAALLIENKDTARADSLIDKVLQRKPDLSTALLLAAGQNRVERKFDASLAACDRMLLNNKEDILAFASKARTLLWMKNDKEALKAVQTAAALAPDNVYVKATLLLAYHFTNQVEKKNALLKEYSNMKDTAARSSLQYAVDVINGKEPFRN
ncbi:MAG: hypothetical protein U0X40_01105 [Ferruginibacter sp.]